MRWTLLKLFALAATTASPFLLLSKLSPVFWLACPYPLCPEHMLTPASQLSYRLWVNLRCVIKQHVPAVIFITAAALLRWVGLSKTELAWIFLLVLMINCYDDIHFSQIASRMERNIVSPRESRKRKTNPSERIQRDRSIIIGDLLPTYLMNSKVSYVSNSKNWISN